MKYCTMEFIDYGCITRFPDGTECAAVPHATPHYHVISHRCGYSDDIGRYCQEHEFAHAFIAEKILDRPSEVLWTLAHGIEAPSIYLYEEMAAQMFQRWLRANEEPILSGADWYALKQEALALLPPYPTQ